jgi:hypothetical protein
MANIKRLLNKKGWTGRELGILELTNTAICFKQAQEGKPQEPLVETAQFRKMLNTITDRQQGQIYNGYISIHEWISIRFNVAQTQFQQAQLRYQVLADYLTKATLAEDVFKYIEELPEIMTQKQYEDAVEAGRQRWIYEDGEPRADSLPALIERGISYYYSQLTANPTKANPLKAIRKKYVSQPVKSKYILSKYNEVAGEGYYTIEDGSGRRSDEMTKEEWQEAITTPAMKEALRKMRATDGYGLEYTQSLAATRIIERAKVIFAGGTEEDADRAQERREHESGLSTPVKWHYYEEPPEDLTKWDIIETGLLEYYNVLFCGKDGSEEDYLAELEDFLSEFRELTDTIIADIEKRYLHSSNPLQAVPVEGREPLTTIDKLPLDQWESTVFSWEDLYRLDVYGFQHDTNEDNTIFDGNRRALFNGIAILRPSDLINRSPRIDESGYYVEPSIRHTLSNYTLEAFFPEAEDYADNLETVEKSRKTFIESYYYCKGFNAALELIGRYYDVPDITVFGANLTFIEEKLRAYNDLIPMLYRSIYDTDYRDKELKERKLQVLRDIFRPIDYESLTIPAENMKQAEELLKDFKAFLPENSAHFDSLFYTLPVREDEGGLA